MPRPRRHDNPAVRMVAYVRSDIRAEMESAASAAGLSLGQFLDRLWMERARTAPTPQLQMSGDPVKITASVEKALTGRKHRWVDNPTLGKICGDCHQRKAVAEHLPCPEAALA